MIVVGNRGLRHDPFGLIPSGFWYGPADTARKPNPGRLGIWRNCGTLLRLLFKVGIAMGAWGRLDKVVAAFSDAAIDPSRWPAAMEAVGQATNSFGALIFPLQGATQQIPHSCSLEAGFDTYVREGWNHRDERFRRGSVGVIRQRGVVTDFDLVTDDEIARMPYYREFLAPQGLRWFGGIIVGCGEVQWLLAIQRKVEQGPFSPDEQDTLKGLSNMLSGAAAIARALGYARADAAIAAFQLSGTAVALIDRLGNVVRHNAAADELFGPDINIHHGRLTSRSIKATASLDRALHSLLWSSSSAALLPPIALPRLRMRPVLAYPARLSEVTIDVLGPCQALVILVDLEARPRPSEATVRAAFGLTEAESRLASHIAAGETVEDCAAKLNVAYETARNQLKAIFAKTNTHRQAELVALLTRLLTNGANKAQDEAQIR